MIERFRVIFLEGARQFLDKLEAKAREKILFNIHKTQIICDPELFKKIYGDIWELRTLFNKTYYRLFAFWDKSSRENTLVVCTHGLVKRTGKTPKSEIAKAEILRKKYFDYKNKQ